MASPEKLYGSKYVEQTTIQKSLQVSIYKLCSILNIAHPMFRQTNAIFAALQCALVGSTDAHRYGSSPLNQRIENKRFMAWVIDHFKSLVDVGKYHLGNYFHKECAWYAYYIFLKQELDTFKVEWNNHYIRK